MEVPSERSGVKEERSREFRVIVVGEGNIKGGDHQDVHGGG